MKPKDWRGEKGKYYDYGYKDAQKKFLDILENKKIEWNNKDWVSNQEVDLINGFVEDVNDKIKQSLGEKGK